MKQTLQRHDLHLLRLGRWQFLLRPRLMLRCACAALLLTLLAALVLPLGPYETVSAQMPTDAEVAALQAQLEQAMALTVWRDIRLPRILTAMLVGAMLGMAGAALQSLARNELADPGLIGVKEGAAVAVIAVALWAPQLAPVWRTGAGLAGGLVVTMLVAALARELAKVRFILVGIGVSWLLHALIATFLTTADVKDVQIALIWIAGSLHDASWQTLLATLPWAGLGMLMLLASSRAADAAALGHGVAQGLGVRLRPLYLLRLLAPCLLTATAVAAVGSLGFVGLIAPHLARLSLGGRQLALLLGSALYGANLVLLADSLGRLAFAPLQLPAGIVLAVVGVPLLLVLLWRRRDQL
jgi:iron complex transport system permease protein